jgi:hypothetical protein
MSLNDIDFRPFLSRLDAKSGVSDHSLAAFEASARISLPNDYLAFLRITNGATGWIGSNYIRLWRLEDLLEKNKAYEVGTYCPTFFFFGSNGGGEAYAFNIEVSMEVFMVPFIGNASQDALRIAPSFSRFLETLHAQERLLDL